MMGLGILHCKAFSSCTVELIRIWSLVDGYLEDKRLDILNGMDGCLS